MFFKRSLVIMLFIVGSIRKSLSQVRTANAFGKIKNPSHDILKIRSKVRPPFRSLSTMMTTNNYVPYSTEERMSIRESMRLFLDIDGMMNDGTSSTRRHTFEELCRASILHMRKPSVPYNISRLSETETNISILDGTNCGSTMGCFAAIFLSKAQLSDHGIRDVISGTNFTQFINNPNILLHTMQSSICRGESVDMCHTITSAISSSISRYVATGNTQRLSNRLLETHSAQEFPLVIFCSMAWSFPTNHSTVPSEIVASATSGSIGDHVFTIVKHNNDHFQVIQGYIEQNYLNSVHSPGMTLMDWRDSKSIYSSHTGFSKDIMTEFCGSLNRFAKDSSFDAIAHKNMFGVEPRGNTQTYWPSFNFMELCDHHITGCGERSLIEAMHSYVTHQHEQEVSANFKSN